MRKLLILTLVTGVFYSCSNKSAVKPTTTQTQQTITITDSVLIGNQYWTTSNYSGTGGVNYNNTATTTANWGKLYTLAEADSIKLPQGWRLPTSSDYTNLLQTEGATTTDNDGYIFGGQPQAVSLMSTSTWLLNIETNSSGFNAYPAGVDGNGGGINYIEAAGYSSTYLIAAFLTSSQFTGTGGGTASFVIYQTTDYTPEITQAAITAYPSGSRASIRFVRDK